jgi:Fe-S-cluster containining protein
MQAVIMQNVEIPDMAQDAVLDNPTKREAFGCQNCGECCKDVTVDLTYLDRRRLRRELKLEDSDFVFQVRNNHRYINSIKLAEDPESGDKYCMFHGWKKDWTSYCKIYKIRPNACRAYPTTAESTHGCPNNYEGEGTLMALYYYIREIF